VQYERVNHAFGISGFNHYYFVDDDMKDLLINTKNHQHMRKLDLDGKCSFEKTFEQSSHALGWKINNLPRRKYFSALIICKTVKDSNIFFCEAKQLT